MQCIPVYELHGSIHIKGYSRFFVEVNGDTMSKNPRVMCLGSALTEKRHELAEEIPGMQGSEEELFGEGGSVGPELETCPFNEQCGVGTREKRKKESGKS